MLESVWEILVIVFAFVGGFSLLVFIHEYGHYAMARLFGTRIDSFSIGFGPEVTGWTDKRGVRWKVCALPLGGYVKFYGDENATSGTASAEITHLSEAEKASIFQYKPLYQRALIVVAGPAVNLIAPIFVFMAFHLAFGVMIAPPIVDDVVGDAAKEAGIEAGDRILSVDGTSIARYQDIGNVVRIIPGETVPIRVERDGQELTLTATIGVRLLEDQNGIRNRLGQLGISADRSRFETRTVGVGEAFVEGVRSTERTIGVLTRVVGQLFQGKRPLNELSGPPRIAQAMGEALNQGFNQFALILALLSLNLGIVNLIPIPGLDGGHLFLYAIEAIRREPLPERLQEIGVMAGMVLLLGFMALVTLNDLQILFL